MKKILLLFLFISSFGFSQEEDYSKIFSNFDSIQKTSTISHINRIIDLSIYEYAKQKKDSSREVIISIKLDSIGQLNLNYIENEEINLDLKDFFIDLFHKTPKIPNKGKKYFSINYVLENQINLQELKDKLYGRTDVNDVDIQDLKILETPPSFPMTNSEGSPQQNFNKNIWKHVQKNFNYPSYAQQNNISGKIMIYFLIERDGSIRRIFSFNSHPILQLEGIKIIKKLPKMNPGYSNGKTIRVSYMLPLSFKLE